jgi:hypothetical protein
MHQSIVVQIFQSFTAISFIALCNCLFLPAIACQSHILIYLALTRIKFQIKPLNIKLHNGGRKT